MEVKINMLNVKDGDAIIIELIKPNDTLVMVIDGGEKNYYTTKVKPKLVEVLSVHNKKAPDVVVCTHYDSDHIGGLIPLVQDYIEDIKQVWVHSSSATLSNLFEQAEILKNEKLSVVNIIKNSGFDEALLEESKADISTIQENKNFVLESLNQLNQLINLIPPIKLKQVFHKDTPLANWPEIQVLGPTEAYFNSLFHHGQNLKALVTEEIQISQNILSESVKRNIELAIPNPCDRLKTDAKATITATNKASIIISIDNNNGRYLFTGDAGIESFKKIPNWQTELKNLFFLKVPHHGSNNNMTKEIAEKMKPKYAYCSGDGHQDEEVIECLAQKTIDGLVATTKSEGDLYFDK